MPDLHRRHGVITFLLLGLCAVLPARGQSTGRLEGRVKDPAGANVEGARVSLFRGDGTEPELEKRTNGDGIFEFDAVSPFTYRLEVEKDGLKTREIQGVTIDPVRQSELAITLEAGQGKSAAESAELESVPTANAEVTTVLTTAQLDRLPLLAGNPLDLVRTQAGVVDTGNVTTVNGLRIPFDNYSLDGVSIQDNYVRSNDLDFIPNRILFGEVSTFTIVTSNGSSTYGNGATQIALASPSGSNQLHGSLYYYNSNNLWNANDWFQSANGLRDHYKLNQGGGSFSGPIVKNRLYFFTTYEFLRTRTETPVTSPVPSASLRQGNYTYTPVGGGQPVTLNVLQAAGLTMDPLIQAFLNKIPLPNGPSTPAALAAFELPGAYATSVGPYYHDTSDRKDFDNVLGRLDYILSPKQTIVGTFAWNRDLDDMPDSSQPDYGTRSPEYQDNDRTFLSLAWRALPSPVFTNEVRFGFNLDPSTFSDRDITAPYYLFFGNVLGVPLSINYGTVFPMDSFYPQGRYTDTYVIQDNAAWTRGNHNIQFGFQSQLIRVDNYDENQYPLVILGGSGLIQSQPASMCTADFNSANYLAGILAGRVLAYQEALNATSQTSGYVDAPYTRHLMSDNYAFYLQDNWRMRSNLALTLGLRYELYPVIKERDGLLLTPKLNGDAMQTIYSPTATYVFSSGPGGQTPYRPDYKNFAPNLGLAFDPFGRGKTLFHAAYSISYVNDDALLAVSTALDSANGNTNNIGLTPTLTNVVYPAPVSLSQAAPSLMDLLPQVSAPFPAGFGVVNPSSPNQSITLIDPNLRTPYVQQWNSGLEQQLKRFMFDVRYVGNHATKLLREANMGSVASNPEATLGARLLGNFSNSTYNGLQVAATRRLAAGLAFQANYTFSKVLSDASLQLQPNEQFYFEPYRDTSLSSLDRARASFDITHAFKANFVYDVPFHGRFSLNAWLGGWSVSGIVIAQSGSPFSILCGSCLTVSGGTNTANSITSLNGVVGFHMTGNGPSVIASSAINPLAGTGIGGFTGQVFQAPASNTLGNLGFRTFNGPATYNFDLGIQKRIKLGERHNIELRGEAFNLLNHPAFFVTDTYVDQPGFGSSNISSPKNFTPRRIQVAMYYRF